MGVRTGSTGVAPAVRQGCTGLTVGEGSGVAVRQPVRAHTTSKTARLQIKPGGREIAFRRIILTCAGLFIPGVIIKFLKKSFQLLVIDLLRIIHRLCDEFQFVFTVRPYPTIEAGLVTDVALTGIDLDL